MYRIKFVNDRRFVQYAEAVPALESSGWTEIVSPFILFVCCTVGLALSSEDFVELCTLTPNQFLNRVASIIVVGRFCIQNRTLYGIDMYKIRNERDQGEHPEVVPEPDLFVQGLDNLG